MIASFSHSFRDRSICLSDRERLRVAIQAEEALDTGSWCFWIPLRRTLLPIGALPAEEGNKIVGERDTSVGEAGEGEAGVGGAGEGDTSEGDAGDGDTSEGEAGEGDTGGGDTGEGDAGDGDAGEGDTGEGMSIDGISGGTPNKPKQNLLILCISTAIFVVM